MTPMRFVVIPSPPFRFERLKATGREGPFSRIWSTIARPWLVLPSVTFPLTRPGLSSTLMPIPPLRFATFRNVRPFDRVRKIPALVFEVRGLRSATEAPQN
jgi:hypothetical protein